MKRVLAVALVVIAIAALAILMRRTNPESDQTTPPTYAAKLFASGEPVSLAALKGKPALLSSWATWCAECKFELPSLEQLWQSRQADGLQIVAVNIDVDGSNPAIGTMIGDFKLTMPIWHDPDNDYSLVFNAPGVPTSTLFDAEGRVVTTWIGRTNFQSGEVSAIIDSLLAG